MGDENDRRRQLNEEAARMLRKKQVLEAAPLLNSFIPEHIDANKFGQEFNCVLTELYQRKEFADFDQFVAEYVDPTVKEAEERNLWGVNVDEILKRSAVFIPSLIGYQLAGIEKEFGKGLIDLFLYEVARKVKGNAMNHHLFVYKGEPDILEDWVKARMVDGAQWRKEADERDADSPFTDFINTLDI